MSEPSILSSKLKLVFATQEPSKSFFGYYYNNPYAAEHKRLLSHRAEFDARNIKHDDTVEVGYYTVDDEKWHHVGHTGAFNWQDGSMLQWIPRAVGKKLIYNILEDGRAKSRLVDIETGEAQIFNAAVYATHPSGEWAIGVNFSRLTVCRPSYGYREAPEVIEYWKGNVHPEDGFFRIDFKTGDVTPFLNTHSIVELMKAQPTGDALHYLHHPMWNPSGTRLIFLHRYSRPDGGFTTRLLSASSSGEDVYSFPDASNYSHAAWRNDEEFVIWSNPGGGIMGAYAKKRRAGSTWLRPVRQVLRFGKRLFGSAKRMQSLTKTGYYLFRDQEAKSQAVGRGKVSMDGHPGFYGEGAYMLADTYQDEESYRHLLSYDMRSESVEELGRFYSPFNNSNYRCDLHPRVTADGQYVCLDSAHTGMRQLYLYQILENKL